MSTEDTVKTRESRFSWKESLGLKKKYKHTVGGPLATEYIEYLSLIKRLIGFLHSTTFDISCWDKVIGRNSGTLVNFNPTGDTESQPTTPRHEIVQNKKGEYIRRKNVAGTPALANQPIERQWQVEDRPMDAEKSLYLSKQQFALLSSSLSAYLTTILIAEFGGGNASYLTYI